MSKENTQKTVQTTGHAWDGDLQEFNNPLPTWWLWSFYASIVAAIIYWFLFPAWPVGHSYTKGIGNNITYTTSDGREVTTHWNTRALLMKELADARQAQAKYVDQLKVASYSGIVSDTEKSAFANSMAKVLFADNCAACHQAGGNGVIGSYPSLADDAWLWGGGFKQIETTISAGRKGFMPAFGKSLSDAQIDRLSEYVLSLSGHEVSAQKAALGAKIFNGQAGGCYACHGEGGPGNVDFGSANLTDSVWTIANVPGSTSLAGKKMAVEQVIRKGADRAMPSWKGRLSATEIKILTYYVHETLGSGQ